MAHHKIVAYQIKARPGALEIYAMTQSPRGTRVYSGGRVVLTEGLSAEELNNAVTAAVLELQSERV